MGLLPTGFPQMGLPVQWWVPLRHFSHKWVSHGEVLHRLDFYEQVSNGWISHRQASRRWFFRRQVLKRWIVFEQILNFCSHSECVTRVSIYAIREAAWSIKFSCVTISTWWSDMSDWQDRKWQNIILGLQIACFQNKAS